MVRSLLRFYWLHGVILLRRPPCKLVHVAPVCQYRSFDVARLAPDPTIDAYYTEAAYKPNGDEELAKDIYKNVQVLGDLTEDNFNRVMNAMTQVGFTRRGLRLLPW